MLCRVHQWLISRAMDEDRRPGAMVRRHMAACAECRRFWEAGLRLEDGLRMEAFDAGRLAGLRPAAAAPGATERPAAEAIGLLRRSAMAADFGELRLRRAQSSRQAAALRAALRQRRRVASAAAVAGLAAAVVLSVFVARVWLWPPGRPGAPPQPDRVVRSTAELPTIGAIVGGDLVPSRSGAALQELAFAPMQQELANLAKDSESAARALWAIVYVDPGRRAPGPQTTRTR